MSLISHPSLPCSFRLRRKPDILVSDAFNLHNTLQQVMQIQQVKQIGILSVATCQNKLFPAAGNTEEHAFSTASRSFCAAAATASCEM